MTRHRLPSLSALRTFEALARTLSFTKAADELGVTQVAVSRQVKALERDLAVLLVHRSSRRNELTDAGEILFGGVYRALEAIEQSVERINGSGNREILNVSIAPYFSARWLTPRLMSFVKRHPEIDLRLHHSYHPADHKREGIDLGINWGSGVWPGVKKEKILDGSLTAVVGAALIERVGPLTDPDQLLDLTLFCEFDPHHWKVWFERAGTRMTSSAKCMRLSDSHALRRVALDGHGVALLFSSLLHDDLVDGALVQPFPTSIHTGYDYYLNYADDEELTVKGRAFRRWILDEVEARADA